MANRICWRKSAQPHCPSMLPSVAGRGTRLPTLCQGVGVTERQGEFSRNKVVTEDWTLISEYLSPAANDQHMDIYHTRHFDYHCGLYQE